MDEHDDLDDGGHASEEAGAGDDHLSGAESSTEARSHAPDSAQREGQLPPREDAPDRAPFSLFSWMRREPGPRPAQEPIIEPGPGTGKPDPLE